MYVIYFQVAVSVEDSNDEIPYFLFLLYTATVLEGAVADTEFLTLSALDPDLSGQVTYKYRPVPKY